MDCTAWPAAFSISPPAMIAAIHPQTTCIRFRTDGENGRDSHRKHDDGDRECRLINARPCHPDVLPRAEAENLFEIAQRECRSEDGASPAYRGGLPHPSAPSK